MKMRLMWSVGVLGIAGLILGLAAFGNVPCVQGQLCLPMPEKPADFPPRAFLPLVMRSGESDPPPLTCEVVEKEYNDIHTLAQPIDHCVNGQATTDLDIDWYRLEACQGPLDLHLSLESETDVDLYVYGDPPGEPLAKSESWDGHEDLDVTGLVTGTYYAVVQPAMAAQGAYLLTVEATWSQ
jgi:hypothetical protein